MAVSQEERDLTEMGHELNRLEIDLLCFVKQRQWKKVGEILLHIPDTCQYIFLEAYSLHSRYPCYESRMSMLSLREKVHNLILLTVKGASDTDFKEFILPNIKSWFFKSDCMNIDDLLSVFQSRGSYSVIGDILKFYQYRRTSSSDQLADKISRDATVSDIVQYILPNSSKFLDVLLESMVANQKWAHLLALKNEIKIAKPTQRVGHDFIEQGTKQLYALGNFDASRVHDSVLELLVQRGLYYPSVCKLVSTGCVSLEAVIWSLVNALNSSSYVYSLGLLVGHCSLHANQLVSILQNDDKKVEEFWNSAIQAAVIGVSEHYFGPSQGTYQFERQEVENDLFELLLSLCPDIHLCTVLPILVLNKLWSSVNHVLYRGISCINRNWAVMEAQKVLEVQKGCYYSKYTFCTCGFLHHITNEHLEAYVKQLVGHENKYVMLHAMKIIRNNSLRHWVMENTLGQTHFWDWILKSHSGVLEAALKHLSEEEKLFACFRSLDHVTQRDLQETETTFVHVLKCDSELTRLLYRSAEYYAEKYQCVFQDIDDNTEIPEKSNEQIQKTLTKVILFLKSKENCYRSRKSLQANELMEWRSELKNINIQFSDSLQAFEAFMTRYMKNRINRLSDRKLSRILALLPLFARVQCAALQMMGKKRRWKVVSQAVMGTVWENIRRELFRFAVEQERWVMVKQLADHTLYDDQRAWAVEEALKKSQWDVLPELCDHGLNEMQLGRVIHRVAWYANRDTVCNMLEHGADVVEFKELLQLGETPHRKAHLEQQRSQRLAMLRDLEHKIRSEAQTWKKSLKEKNWAAVLHGLRKCRTSEKAVDVALKLAVKAGAGHVVIQIIKLGIRDEQANDLFMQMVEKEQWGVCRVLIERGVNLDLVQSCLPSLLNGRQWLLLARVMAYNISDQLRQSLMEHAFEQREGSVVWQGITTMHRKLSLEERESLFQQALNRNVWQVVKPLIEFDDELGMKHRDKALLEAIDQHQWDVVDHCLKHKANIDMLDENGETPLLRRARGHSDWECVEELVKRGASQARLDIYKRSVLHYAVWAKKWKTVDLLVQYHGKLNMPDAFGQTPLHMLISERQARIIERALFWEADLSSARNVKGETTLHAVCLAGWRFTMYYLIARGSDPLAVTKTGDSVLMYAVKNEKKSQLMLAQCINLGLSTHQPSISNDRMFACDLEVEHHHLKLDYFHQHLLCSISPFAIALFEKSAALVSMLYESGACSNLELFRLYTTLEALNYVREGRVLKEKRRKYLREKATNPRSLQSTCRLMIFHSMNVRGKRHKDVLKLPLKPEHKLFDYITFKDITDPDYGKFWMW